jgi:hypothetical protein
MGLGLYPQAWASFLDRFGGAVSPAVRDYGERLGGRALSLLDEVAGGPQRSATATRPGQHLLPDAGGWRRPEGGRPLTLIDWQIAGRAVGTYDVAYFLSQSPPPTSAARASAELLRAISPGARRRRRARATTSRSASTTTAAR